VITRDGNRLAIAGPLLMPNIRQVLEAGSAEVQHGADVADLGAVTEVDSSAVALLLELQREARRDRRMLRCINVPSNLMTLGDLYGVTQWLATS
jgi:phospholipid transport system transporter-binding protein